MLRWRRLVEAVICATLLLLLLRSQRHDALPLALAGDAKDSTISSWFERSRIQSPFHPL